ncbi:MAG: uracil-DNA glycosylase [Hyphomicrobiales bacterium]|nr:uracil-DNA glycosylase [Hyphomicrobiales bacterium]
MNDPPTDLHSYSYLELLMWYKDAGVDLAMGDEPVDQFALSRELALSRKNASAKNTIAELVSGPSETVTQNSGRGGEFDPRSLNHVQNRTSSAAMPDENAVNEARQRARAAGSVDELREAMAGFKGCNLHLSAKNMVFADGDPAADIMLIGEAPGRDDDIHGLPFVGRAGQLLDSMLAAIKLERENIYLTNIIPWRPPGNRTPTVPEIEICRPFIERHIELICPKMIIILGGAAAKILLNSTQGIVKLRGRWKTCEMADRRIDAITIFHPANLLDHPAQKKMAWQDLLKIRQKLLDLRQD